MDTTKIKVSLLAGLSTLFMVGCAYVWPTQYIEPDGSRSIRLAMDAELAIKQDANRLALNGELYTVGQNQALLAVGIAGALGVPGSYIMGLRKKRAEDMSPEEQDAFYDRTAAEIKELLKNA